MKLTFWSNVAVSRNLVELCLKDHQKLGQRIYQIRSMVAKIGEVAAKLGNIKYLSGPYGMSTFMKIIGIMTYS
jgi:hypothetical protein